MAHHVHVRVADRVEQPVRRLRLCHVEPTVDAGHYEVKLSQDIVGEVELPVSQDVALRARQNAKIDPLGSVSLVELPDLVQLTFQPVDR